MTRMSTAANGFKAVRRMFYPATELADSAEIRSLNRQVAAACDRITSLETDALDKRLDDLENAKPVMTDNIEQSLARRLRALEEERDLRQANEDDALKRGVILENAKPTGDQLDLLVPRLQGVESGLDALQKRLKEVDSIDRRLDCIEDQLVDIDADIARAYHRKDVEKLQGDVGVLQGQAGVLQHQSSVFFSSLQARLDKIEKCLSLEAP